MGYEVLTPDRYYCFKTYQLVYFDYLFQNYRALMSQERRSGSDNSDSSSDREIQNCSKLQQQKIREILEHIS